MKIDLADIREFGQLDFLARQLVEGFITGLHKSPYHGFSVEFAEHRLYNPGESTRHIDWKVYARTDRLYTKRYEEETNLRCQLVIDNSSSMHYPYPAKSKLKFSIMASAALAYLLQKQRDAVGLTVFSEKIQHTSPQKSTRSNLNKMMVLLEHLFHEPSELNKTNVAGVLHEIAQKNHRRSLIIIFSDMFDSGENANQLFQALQHLKHNKHEVLLFHVTDQNTERKFNFEERPYEFIDLETGAKIKLNPTEVKDRYLSEVEQFYKDIKLKCAQYKIDLIEADISSDYHDILKAYMLKRSRMH